MNLWEMTGAWVDSEREPQKFSWDEVLPWEWHKVFGLFPPEVLEIVTRALCYKADKWIDGYMDLYKTHYRREHVRLSAEQRFQARERVISVMMYGLGWVSFEVCAAGYMRHKSKEEGLILEFLKNFSPIKQKDA